METVRSYKKVVKNKLISEKLEEIKKLQNTIYVMLLDLLKLNADMIQFVSQPVKKSA
jgi:hypothetical protein